MGEEGERQGGDSGTLPFALLEQEFVQIEGMRNCVRYIHLQRNIATVVRLGGNMAVGRDRQT